ncbi:MAG TPA: DegT/DnrJ/EryC1/StrS family aminotransferase [Parachlamydiaceae bacterium]|nr:DegT/DnrJ/EryC1/StrS family aminotransferase [Parachlamydiaceae bacterium]
MNNFIPYTKQTLEKEDIEQATAALKEELITRGPHAENFEKSMAHYCGAQYAVSFNSATTALYAATFAGRVGSFDDCLTTPNSFIASAGCAASRGAKPVFLDIDRETGNFNLDYLKYNLEKKKSRGKTVILPVHFAGIPVDMEKLDSLIADPNALVIEDAAHAIGSSYKDGSKVGSCKWSHMTVFSFHPAKQLTTGEGGMVLTNDEELCYRLKLYRNNGIVKEGKHLIGKEALGYYEVHDLTGNFHLTDFQAALGLSQLKRVDAIAEKRRVLIKEYRKLLKDVPNIKMFTKEFDDSSSFHLAVVQIDFEAFKTTREKVMFELKEKGIGTQCHYIPIYRHPVFSKVSGDINEYFPEMERYYAQALSLPLYTNLKLEEVNYVVNSLKQVLQLSQ